MGPAYRAWKAASRRTAHGAAEYARQKVALLLAQQDWSDGYLLDAELVSVEEAWGRLDALCMEEARLFAVYVDTEMLEGDLEGLVYARP